MIGSVIQQPSPPSSLPDAYNGKPAPSLSADDIAIKAGTTLSGDMGEVLNDYPWVLVKGGRVPEPTRSEILDSYAQEDNFIESELRSRSKEYYYVDVFNVFNRGCAALARNIEREACVDKDWADLRNAIVRLEGSDLAKTRSVRSAVAGELFELMP